MKVERFTIKACCGRQQISFKLDKTVDHNLLEYLKSHNFREATHFTKSGMIYVDNLDLIVTAPFGGNKLNVKCRKEGLCDKILNDFEELLQKWIK